MKTESNYLKVLEKVEGKVKRLRDQAAAVRWFYENGDPEESYNRSLKLEETAEKMVLLTRALPAYTGSPKADTDVEAVMAEVIPVEIGFTEEGWFSIRLPTLLPKKGEGSPDYIRSFLYPAMRRYFEKQPPARFLDCVLIYRHVYDRTRPERQKRDHDNIEVNMVTDIVAMYVLPDDAPSICSHYYCSADASEDRTEVYVVPRKEFPMWLVMESTMPDKGVFLHENRLLWRKKHM